MPQVTPLSKTLFAFDLDGTLVHAQPDGRRMIPDALSKVLFKLSQRSRVIVATGRRMKVVIPDLQSLPSIPYFVVHNGLVIKNAKHQTIHSHEVTVQVAREIFKLIEREGLDPFYVSDSFESGIDFFFSKQRLSHSAPLRAMLERKVNTCHLLEDDELPKAKLLEVGVLGEFADLVVLKKKIDPLLPAPMRSIIVKNIGSQKYSAMEIFDQRHSKGSAVNYVKNILGMERVISVGDDGNDFEMIQMADVGIAMSHASDTLKAVAQRVVEGPEGLVSFLQGCLDEGVS